MSALQKMVEGIADAILSASVYGVATRIALKRAPSKATSHEEDLGGLNRKALIAVIEKHLAAAQLAESKERE